MKIALTIAGSDSGGGAGIQADLKTFQSFGVFGTSVITAVTAQNTVEVRSVYPMSAQAIDDQLAAIADDLPPAALKSGMLADRDTIDRVASAIERHGWTNYVLDPVMIATSGDLLHTEDTAETILHRLVPLSTVLTPNAHEAARLAGLPVTDLPSKLDAAHRLLECGARAVLITGGDGAETIEDLLVTAKGHREFSARRIETSSTHGTGCTLAAAITAGLALGYDTEPAVASAIAFVRKAIAAAPGLGRGHGPLNHRAAAP
jgi:hydroxymethylpyrimidine/phosphomethylpyrimidine kinase